VKTSGAPYSKCANAGPRPAFSISDWVLEHDPEKWKPVFPRDKREAFARRSCSNNKMTDEHDSTQLKHALNERLRLKAVDWF
jgi:hypothetical protein